MKIKPFLWRIAVCVGVAGVLCAATLITGRNRGWFEPSLPGGRATVRLISNAQYTSTIQDLFGEDITVSLSLPTFQRLQGLAALGSAAAEITPGALEQFEISARKIALQVVDETHRNTLVPCAPASQRTADAACARAFLSRVGRVLYRRPLTPVELETQVDSAGVVTEQLHDFYLGLGYSLAGMLVSPKFLYLTEVLQADPDRSAGMRLDGYSKAQRLSLFLWNALPDDELIRAAEIGEIHTRRGLQRQVDRLLESPRLEQGVRAFFVDLLDFDSFETLSKDPVIYPVFTSRVTTSAKEQALQIITQVLLTKKEDYRNLFTTSQTYVDETLGTLYNTPVPNPRGWVTYDLPTGEGAGLLTSLGFLALHSHPGRSSPTRRGKAVREELLCQQVPNPPPNVNFSVFDDPNRHFKTARQRLQAHATDPVCAGCHKLTDPVGLALENFDGAGQFRIRENDARIDPTGELDGRSFSNVATLGQALHDHRALGSCLASRLFAYGLGREVVTADRSWLAYIVKRFAANGYRFPNLLREIVLSRAFFSVAPRRDTGSTRELPQTTSAGVESTNLNTRARS